MRSVIREAARSIDRARSPSTFLCVPSPSSDSTIIASPPVADARNVTVRGSSHGPYPRASHWKNPTPGCEAIASIAPKNRSRWVAPPSVTRSTEWSDDGDVPTAARSSEAHES